VLFNKKRKTGHGYLQREDLMETLEEDNYLQAKEINSIGS
jgi:hypothetical protein